MSSISVRNKFLAAALAATALLGTLSACSKDDSPTTVSDPAGKVTIGQLSNGAGTETQLDVPVNDAARAKLPQAIRDGGTLVIGVGSLPAGSVPLGYVGTDGRTVTGSEPDLGRLVAATLGLKPDVQNATWENMFVGLDSGKTHVAFDNITDTEERKKKYDFATYRKDDVAFETLATSTWTFDNTPQSLAGKTVAVSAGTNQEKILIDWQTELRGQGKDLTIKYFPDINSIYLALAAGKIDTYLTPSPAVAYHVRQAANTPTPTRLAGAFSGAGPTLQGLIAATIKKDSGLVQSVADAINALISGGQYAAWLKAWNLSNESVDSSQVNPAGLPITQ